MIFLFLCMIALGSVALFSLLFPETEEKLFDAICAFANEKEGNNNETN